MTVTDRKMALGEWQIGLIPNTPRIILDQLDVRQPGVGFSNIVITPTRLDPLVLASADLLAVAAYVGVYRGQPDDLTLEGCGVNWYLGDEDGKGPAYNTGVSTAGGTFAQWAAALKPAWMTAGVVSTISGTFSKVYPATNLLTPLQDVCNAFGAEWRVNTSLKFDIGLPADLFNMASPRAVMVRDKEDSGRDLGLEGILGALTSERDLDDWTRRIDFITGSSASPVVTVADGGVAALDVPYRAGNGSALPVDRIIEAFDTPSGSETSLAAAQYGRFNSAHQELTLSSSMYDVSKSFNVGDNIYVYDRARGIFDLTNPVIYRGVTIYPEIIRCVGLTWPVREGMGVYSRQWVKGVSSWTEKWIDLSNYIAWETGDTTVEVGNLPRPT